MKLHWGWAITCVYIAFMIGILSFVYIATTHTSDLVREDYYEAGQSYQQRIEAIARTSDLTEQPSVKIEGKMVRLLFPYSVEANLHFYRPSDAKRDFSMNIIAKKTELSLSKFKRGFYKTKLSWEKEGKSYYWESNLYIP